MLDEKIQYLLLFFLGILIGGGRDFVFRLTLSCPVTIFLFSECSVNCEYSFDFTTSGTENDVVDTAGNCKDDGAEDSNCLLEG